MMRLQTTGYLLALLLSNLLLTSCASNIPEDIKTAPVTNVGLESVRTHPEAFQSQPVRWGGIILETENTKAATHLTILALELNSFGQPITSDDSPGRFIAIVPQFLEPAVYAQDRMITVRGEFLHVESRKVGEFSYDYPVVEVKNYHLWPIELPSSDMDAPPWWYDPWYSPYYYPHGHHH